MAKNLQNLSLLDISPGSIKADKAVNAAIKAIDPELKGVSQDISEAFIISRIDELPEALIDLLAAQWHVDFYEPELALSVKRNLVKNSINWHKIKGTPCAVEQLVAALFNNCRVSEWFEYNGRRYFFQAKVDVGGLNTLEIDSADLARMRCMVNCGKSARSWLEFIALIDNSEDYTDIKAELIEPLKILTELGEFYPYKGLNWLDWFKHNAELMRGGIFAHDLRFLHNKNLLRNGLSSLMTGTRTRSKIEIDDLNYWLKLSEMRDDYTHEYLPAYKNAQYKHDLSLFRSLDGKKSAVKILPQDLDFKFGLNAHYQDTEQVKERNKFDLHALLEDYYLYDNLRGWNWIYHDNKIKRGGKFGFDARFKHDKSLTRGGFHAELNAYRNAQNAKNCGWIYLGFRLADFHDDYAGQAVEIKRDGEFMRNKVISHKQAPAVWPVDFSFSHGVKVKLDEKLDAQDTEQVLSVNYELRHAGIIMRDNAAFRSAERVNNVVSIERGRRDNNFTRCGLKSRAHDMKLKINAA